MNELLLEIKTLLKDNQFLTGGVMLGLLASIFYPLKSLPLIIWNKIKFYFTYKIYLDQNDEVYNIFTQWFSENYPSKFKNIEVRFNPNIGNNIESSSIRKRWKLWKFQYIDSNFIFYNKRLLWISKKRKELESARDAFSRFHNSYEISGFFAKEAIEEICKELIAKKVELEGNNPISIFATAQYGNFDKIKTNPIKDFDNIFFKEKENYLTDLDKFMSNKEFYKRRGINYKRTYLLYGRGGTGKSSVAGATAKYLDYDLYIFNINAIENDGQFIQLISKVPSKSVIVFEDIDCHINDRDIKNDEVSFSTLLNVMDGLYSPSDVIFILTTNKIEKLDEAFLRKGRVDLQLCLDYPDVNLIEQFVSSFYETPISLNKGFIDVSMSTIQDICLNHDLENAIKEIHSLYENKIAIAAGGG